MMYVPQLVSTASPPTPPHLIPNILDFVWVVLVWLCVFRGRGGEDGGHASALLLEEKEK